MATQWTAGLTSGSTLSANTLNTIGAVWEAYTPALNAWTLGNGTITGRYCRVQKLVNFEVKFTRGSTSNTSALGPQFGFPIAARSGTIAAYAFRGYAQDVSTGVQYPMAAWPIGTDSFYPATMGAGSAFVDSFYTASNTPFTWATGDVLYLAGFYEAG
jgi:hypothetical protein